MKKLGKKALKQIRQLIQQTLQEALKAELEEFLGYSKMVTFTQLFGQSRKRKNGTAFSIIFVIV